MSRCIEQEICDISNKYPNKKINFSDWYIKTDPPTWITTDFECRNIPIDDPQRKTMFIINKPVGVGYNIVKNPFYGGLKSDVRCATENLKLEKHGYYKYFGEFCVE